MPTILITGGTGLIGTELTKELVNQGYNVIVLSRKPGSNHSNSRVTYAQWNVNARTIDTTAIAEADYIIHLAGANVADGRWTDKRKKEILTSRTESGALLIKALSENSNKVKAVISSSAIGWYGADPQIPNFHPFTESAPADHSFLGTTCKAWEDSIAGVSTLGKRLVILRTGIVLSKKGGAYKEFKKPSRFGTVPILGDGRQAISWIHINDIVRLYIFAIENDQLEGIYNAVAPSPVSNKDLMHCIAKKERWALPIHVPAFMLKLVLGEMSIEVLKSATVGSDKIEKAGFAFQFPAIEAAVDDLG
ncbi:MAG TPA: TIGR01777 family oxidoreductase [Chitinophagaceae bacterium]|nr:TIGR01777 family oxidoreductase [Chitinophagaceae bacterium]